LIASRVGIFAEELEGRGGGVVVPPGDAQALACALRRAIELRPRGAVCAAGRSWEEIGRDTRIVYEGALAEFGAAGARG
jgi:glycosyltransferase involved in cell wall biosynthesis